MTREEHAVDDQRTLIRELRAAWLTVRRDYFPRWDRAGEWRLTLGTPGRCQGRCDDERRRVRIGARHDDPAERDALLIHEICHAVADPGHAGKWLRRMRRAAEHAEALGNRRLAEVLLAEVRDYENAPRETVAYGYQQLADWTAERPDLPYTAVRNAVAADLGMTVAEFEKRYRRARRVHAGARQDALGHLEERSLAEARQRLAGRG
jgi:hypothetical protein